MMTSVMKKVVMSTEEAFILRKGLRAISPPSLFFVYRGPKREIFSGLTKVKYFSQEKNSLKIHFLIKFLQKYSNNRHKL